MLSPSKTSLTMSEDCEEMLPSKKTDQESLALEEKLEAASLDGRLAEESWGGNQLSVSYQLEKNRTNGWYAVSNWSLYGGQRPVKAVGNKGGHKFNMTEGEYISSWKYGSKKLKDVLIQSISEKSEVVGRLRSEARKGKAKAASPASQELKIGGGSSTVNYAPESSDIEAGTPSTQANDEHAEHTNPETGGGSSTAQNEPRPNHRGLPVVGDHQVRNVQVNGPMNQTVNYAPESSDIEAGTSSTHADDDPAEHTNLETGGGSSTAQNEPHTSPEIGGGSPTAQNDSHTNPETGGDSPTAQNERRPNHQGLPVGGEPAPHRCPFETIFTVIGECVSIFLAVKSDKNSAGGMTTEEKYFWDFLILCIIVGIISFCYGLCLSDGGGRGRRSMVARVANAVSYVATGLAVVTAAGLQFHNQKMVWLIPLFWAIIVPAIVCYAMKQG